MNQDHTYPLPDLSHRHVGNQPPDLPTAGFLSWPWEKQQQLVQQLERLADTWSQTSPSTTHNPYPTPTQLHNNNLPDLSPPSSQSQSDSSSQDAPILSPLPLQGMQQLIPYADVVTPPTPPASESALHSPASSYHTPYTSLMDPSALAQVPSPTSPYASSFGSPFTQLSPIMSPTSMGQSYPSPTLSSMLNYSLNVSSPSMASPMSFYSMNSPGMASTSSLYNMSQTTSPAMPPLPLTESPGSYSVPLYSPVDLPSVQQYVPYQPRLDLQPPMSQPVVPNRHRHTYLHSEGDAHGKRQSDAVPRLLAATRHTQQRRRVPQTVKLSEKRNLSFAEHFKLDGAPGVPVRGVLDGDIVVDGHDERVLERTGVRQIRVVIAWPGYQQVGTYIHVQDSGRFITRGQLAKLLCAHISRAVEKSARPDFSSSRDARRWTLSNGKGQHGVSIDNLWLLCVAPAMHNIWIAELEVL
ncbi:hypothetical protein C8Q80DRAFT_293354 [Daedaleopsis nitida]|nr:hypothetical protein C8Q80DRAFT_293354 [Daedaleopsis nitida]